MAVGLMPVHQTQRFRQKINKFVEFQALRIWIRKITNQFHDVPDRSGKVPDRFSLGSWGSFLPLHHAENPPKTQGAIRLDLTGFNEMAGKMGIEML
jgi:hypothetical protein